MKITASRFSIQAFSISQLLPVMMGSVPAEDQKTDGQNLEEISITTTHLERIN